MTDVLRTMVENTLFVADFNESLQVGQRVEVRWTNNGRFNVAVGTIQKLNKLTARVALEKEFKNDLGTWPAGHVLSIPRPIVTEKAFTNNNGIFPLSE